ncbi:MAG: 50S ribosomal protein L25/general stress protein Ctc [Candidatus Omnitrophota bacterium]
MFALKAKTRQPNGTRVARNLRRGGRIPGILYGHGIRPLSLEVEQSDLVRALHTKAGENVLINLEVPGVDLKETTCRIKEIQQNPITEEIQHVDFTLISLKEKIEVNVPVVIQNAEEAAGVKEGGILDVVIHEVLVECLPTQIPASIEVDVKAMKIGDAIHIKDLRLPEAVLCKIGPEEILVAVHAPKKEEEPAAEEAAPTQPEVIEKGKKDKEGKEEGKETKEVKEAKEQPKGA